MFAASKDWVAGGQSRSLMLHVPPDRKLTWKTLVSSSCDFKVQGGLHCVGRLVVWRDWLVEGCLASGIGVFLGSRR